METPAGGSGHIRIEYNTGNSYGRRVKSIYVYSNDPVHRVIRLSILADVVEKGSSEMADSP